MRVRADRVHVDQKNPASIARAVELLQQQEFQLDVRRISASTTVAVEDDLVLVDATAGAVTVTLPYIDDVYLKRYIVKKIDASVNAVTVQGSGSETVDGGTIALAAQYDVADLMPERDLTSGTAMRYWWRLN